MTRTLVIVESPTKAKTLEKFLGKDYVVESSIGHVRDLPAGAAEIPKNMKGESWARLGVDVDDDFRPLYVVQAAKKQKITELKRILKDVDEVLLATDEDREGEAISWHLLEVLKPKVPVRRMVFHEITKEAILASLADTRDIDENLVQAQETRRIIDRLYGYGVSPILWRKVAPKLSAGRVQSVAIRMLVERERARMRFKPAQYWDLLAKFETAEGKHFEARLHTLGGQRLASGKDFDPDTGILSRDGVHHLRTSEAAELRSALENASFSVLSAEEDPFTRKPAPPFTTSTLQQEGNNKLKFNAKRTMRAAQRLYESGYITYMRTDSVVLSEEAIRMTRAGIAETYGDAFLPKEPRTYKTKVRNAQEAHEAIRPAGTKIAGVSEVRKKLGEDEARVYELIWKRTMACQMPDAKGRRMTLRVTGTDQATEDAPRDAIFQATGSVIDFHGFLRAHVEGAADPEAALAERETLLPPVAKGDPLTAASLGSDEHHTTPPARLTEASLVRAMEESGIGRPSTYASIIDTIERRDYTIKKGSALVPTFTAFAVVALMESHLTHLIDPAFTAKMEDHLDAISRGEEEKLPYLREFYFDSERGLKPMLEVNTEEIDPRTVCSIPLGTDAEGRELIARVGRYGPFLQREDQTAPIPDQTCPDELTVERATELIENRARGDEPIGLHPESGLPVHVKIGRYGPYVQLGLPEDKKEKPKMVSLLKGMNPEDVTLDLALQLLELPRVVGVDDDGVEIIAYNGRYGPYIKRDADTRSLGPDDDLLKLSRERALALLAEEKKGRGYKQPAKPLKVFEKVAELDGADVQLLPGRYGPYVTDGEVNASLPRDMEDPLTLTISHALELLEARRQTQGAKKGRKKKATKKAAKKATTKKAPAKKKASKKAGKSASKKPS